MNTKTTQLKVERKPVKTLHIPVYSFDDLDDNAKEVARNWSSQQP